jgi:O-antigen chain-terminating methyltransferase
LSSEGKIAAIRVDGLPVAFIAWLLERGLRTVGLRPLARHVARIADNFFAGREFDDADDARTRTGAAMAVLRFVESWRAPLEAHAGRTAVLEREVHILRDTVHDLTTNVQQLRSELHYARHAASQTPPTPQSLQSPSSISTQQSTQNNHSASNNQSARSDHSASEENTDLDAYYVAFEDANRGSHQAFIDKLSVYVGVFEKLQQPGRGPLLDIGCGRGELLDHLKGLGITARGVDTNPVMIALCRERGHDVEQGDALTVLRSLPDESLAAVSGFHIIEHLPFEVLFALVRECRRVLQPNGFILFETPNPENVLVGSHTFYHDFTHRNPVTPTAIQFLAQYHGFADLQIIRSSPYPHSAKVPGDDALTQRVNGHFCGPQDFALLASKPASVATSRPA